MMKTLYVLFLWFGLSVSIDTPKKGVCVGPNNYLCDDLSALNNVHWWWDWGLNPLWDSDDYPDCGPVEQQFVPMSWGWWPGSSNITGRIPEDADFLMGWNEPNMRDQANLTPAQAAEYWPILESQAGGRLLVTPSASPCNNPDRCHSNYEEWFDEFFDLCVGCHFDYLASHYYACNPDWAMSHVRGLYNRYGLQVWLTEFSCPDDDPDVVLDYMQRLIPRLENDDAVFRYSWYQNRLISNAFPGNSNSLLEADSSTLTPLGQWYNNYNP